MGLIRGNYKIIATEIPDETISSTAMFADSVVGASALGAGAVGAAGNIADGVISVSHFADSAVSTSAIAASAVTVAKAGIGLSWVTDSFVTSTSTDGTLFFSTGAGLPSMIHFINLSTCAAGISCGAGVIEMFGVPSIEGSVVYATVFARAYAAATFTQAMCTASRIQWFALIGSR